MSRMELAAGLNGLIPDALDRETEVTGRFLSRRRGDLLRWRERDARLVLTAGPLPGRPNHHAHRSHGRGLG